MVPVVVERLAFSGAALRKARERKHKTREQLAVGIGRSADTVARYERNEVRPPLSVVPKLAEELGVGLEELYGAAS